MSTQRKNETREHYLRRENARKTKWRKDHPMQHKAQEARRRERNRARIKSQHDKWVLNNRQKKSDYDRLYRITHRAQSNAATRRYQDRNRDKIRKSACERSRRKENRAKQFQRHLERYENDPVYNLAVKIRRRIHVALKSAYRGIRKAETTVKLLGCSYTEFKQHVESQFIEGMTWDGVFDGSIEIDHVRPIALFNLIDPLQQKIAFNFQNCKPMWKQDHAVKTTADLRVIKQFRQGAA